MGISYEEADQIVKEAELRKFSDNDLLLELRRRKRFERVEAQQVIPGYVREMGGPPREYVIPRLLRNVVYDIGEKIVAGHLKLPGMKEEEGYFDLGRPRVTTHAMKDLRYFIPLNFVVEKP